MLTFKRDNLLNEIQVHHNSSYVAYIDIPSLELSMWIDDEWCYIGKYATLKEAYKIIKERLNND